MLQEEGLLDALTLWLAIHVAGADLKLSTPRRPPWVDSSAMLSAHGKNELSLPTRLLRLSHL